MNANDTNSCSIKVDISSNIYVTTNVNRLKIGVIYRKLFSHITTVGNMNGSYPVVLIRLFILYCKTEP